MANRSVIALLLLGLLGMGVLAIVGCAPTFDAGELPDLKPAKKADQITDAAPPAPRPDLSPLPDLAQPAPDLTCGGMTFALERIPPNVMLVLDRSGSMGDPISASSTTTKWDDLKAALKQLVTNYDSQVRFGVDLYSSDNNCGAGPVALACANANGQNVLGKVNAASPAGNTPTAATLQAVINAGAVKDPSRTNVVVLATDGLPNCGDTDVAGRIQSLYAGVPSVRTFVIGVGDGTASNPTLLNSWAVAGHTDLAGATKYYQTNSQAQLKAAFDAIAGGIVSCAFKMSAQVPDPSQIYVWSNGTPVANDPVNGFTYDDATPSVTLHGAACDALKASPTNQVQVTYGCATPPPIS